MLSRIVRRVLINHRADVDAVRRLLPEPFRPEIVRGSAVIGICVVELAEMRPAGAPRRLGRYSQSAAHRVAVEWDEDGALRRGVYVLRRHSASRLNVAVGGRLFPGVHHSAEFAPTIADHDGSFRIDMMAGDATHVSAQLRRAAAWQSELFGDVADASAFFERGSLGLSPRRNGLRLDAVELQAERWHVDPLRLESATSTLFEQLLPSGSYEPDCALVMHDVRAVWRAGVMPSSWPRVPSPA